MEVWEWEFREKPWGKHDWVKCTVITSQKYGKEDSDSNCLCGKKSEEIVIIGEFEGIVSSMWNWVWMDGGKADMERLNGNIK